MPDIPQSFPRAGAAVCAVCGRRPGTLRRVVAPQSGPTQVAMCETCARELTARGAAMAPADTQTSGDEPQSKTTTLDELCRDLTGARPPRRHDPRLARDDA